MSFYQNPFLLRSHNLHEGDMDVLPRLHKIKRQSANTVTVGGKVSGKIARGAWVQEHALGLFPIPIHRTVGAGR